MAQVNIFFDKLSQENAPLSKKVCLTGKFFTWHYCFFPRAGALYSQLRLKMKENDYGYFMATLCTGTSSR